MLFHNRLRDPKPQPGSRPLFRCEERVEDLSDQLLAYARTSVGDRENSVISAHEHSDLNLAFGFHCLKSIHQQVRDDLPDLSLDATDLNGSIEPELDGDLSI